MLFPTLDRFSTPSKLFDNIAHEVFLSNSFPNLFVYVNETQDLVRKKALGANLYFWKRTQDVASSKSCVHVDGLFAKRSRKQPTEHMSIIFPNALAIVARACSSGEIKEVSATAARRKKQLGGEINSVNKLMPTCLALERSANICQPEKRNARAEHILHTRRCLHSLSRSSSHLSINECTWWVEAISIPSDALARAELSRHFGARIFHHCAANLMLLCSARLSRQVKSISACMCACPPGLNVTVHIHWLHCESPQKLNAAAESMPIIRTSPN